MKETVMTSARETYEPPYADIIEFAVERGFEGSPGVVTTVYNTPNGTEMLWREEDVDI